MAEIRDEALVGRAREIAVEIHNELIDAARNAALRNKPTMWAYYTEMADCWASMHTVRDPVQFMQLLHQLSENAASEPDEHAQAQCYALGVYARKGLRRLGVKVKAPSLDWMRAAVGLPVKPQRWAKGYDACVHCGLADLPHNSHGLCSSCHSRKQRGKLAS